MTQVIVRRPPALSGELNKADEAFAVNPPMFGGEQVFYDYPVTTVPVPTKPVPPDPSLLSQRMAHEVYYQTRDWQSRVPAEVLAYPSFYGVRNFPVPPGTQMMAKPRFDTANPYPCNPYTPPIEQLRQARSVARGVWTGG